MLFSCHQPLRLLFWHKIVLCSYQLAHHLPLDDENQNALSTRLLAGICCIHESEHISMLHMVKCGGLNVIGSI